MGLEFMTYNIRIRAFVLIHSVVGPLLEISRNTSPPDVYFFTVHLLIVKAWGLKKEEHKSTMVVKLENQA